MSFSEPVSPLHSDAAFLAGRLAAIVESSDDAIVSKTLDGIVMTWNASAERIFGYSAKEMIGSSIYLLIPPEFHEEERQVLQRIRQGERVAHFETTRRRKDGTLFPVDLTVSPVRDGSGRIVGASSIKRDISDRKTALATSARLAAIVQSSDDAIVSKTLDGIILDWNAAAERMYGFSARDMVGRSIYTVVPDELQLEEEMILKRVAQGEHVAHYETTRLRSDGKRIDIALTVSPVRDPDGAIIGASSIQRDITERRRAEEALRQASKMEAIGALAGGLAHDFNNQLYAVSGFAHFISRDPGLSPSARADLLEIQKTTERMASLTRQLLAFARQQVLSPETLDLNAVVQDTSPMLQRLIGSATSVDLSLAPGPKWVRVDRAQMVQVLLNLVINARDAMPTGGRITIRTETLEVSPGQVLDRLQTAVEAGAYAELSVSDTGQGIPAEHLPHIFEPFYTTKEVGLGTGLGLATVDGIVAQSRGHIQVQSLPGRGTTIKILLPLTSEPAPSAPSRLSAHTARQTRGRIMVVDDEDSVRAVMGRTLQAEGYDVLRARDGREALRELEELGGLIDLIITDLVMPGMGGRVLAQELERRYPELPVVWLSGHPREVEFPLEIPGQEREFLMKPVSPQALLDTVARVLEKTKRPNQAEDENGAGTADQPTHHS
ncbi:MAG TPA: PAS domain S-box protein [Gemmatimonadales bacterium]|nr:PAS domain S-box protein [Gemmatimonadales bacterium]